MLVYRDSRTRVSANELVRQLERALTNLRSHFTDDALLAALLRAGELECALSDADSSGSESAAGISDQLARLACSAYRWTQDWLRTCQRLLDSIRHDGELTVSRPEGFAYYALHPQDFADLATGLAATCAHAVGIRSIGTTLSAIVAAKLNADGISATRTTVRPEGHPYDRYTKFTRAQCAVIKQALSRGAVFLVCDEGPGRSGSSLLSVADALEHEGVGRDRIVLLCSHQPNVDALCASNAAARWRRYRSFACGMTKRLPEEAGQYLGGGDWRRFFLPKPETWPAAWPQMERLKFLSRDCQSLFKFEGHGPYGELVRQRDERLAAAGFGAPYAGHEAGFGIHELVVGSQPHVAKPSFALLSRVAKYCTWRAEACSATVSQENIRQLEHMAAFNVEQEFGFAPDLRLEVERPAICDGRMQPNKWRELDNSHWTKLDASTHGDDHFFPGPTDIAWDLAGVCAEWQLKPGHREFFLSEYRRMSGDNASIRLPQYEVAYSAFRLGWSLMAAASVCDSDDEGRLLHDAVRYRDVLDCHLATTRLVG